MPWIKVDDAFAEHPKVMALGRQREAAMGVWLIGLCYAGRHLTDGYVPHNLLTERQRKLAAELVRVGLWMPDEDGWSVHDYGRYQPSAEEVRAQRTLWAARQRRARLSGSNGESHAQTHAQSHADTPAGLFESRSRSRIDPVPDPVTPRETFLGFGPRTQGPQNPDPELHNGRHGASCIWCAPSWSRKTAAPPDKSTEELP